MTVKRKDFQKASAFINEFLLKLSEQDECAELRDALNLALLHMQRYYRKLRLRSQSRSPNRTLGSSMRDHSPMTPFRDTPEKYSLKWINLESPKVTASLPLEGSNSLQTLPLMIQATKHGDEELMQQLLEKDSECVNSADCFGRTALMYAAHFNKLNALKLLLENKADPESQDHDGVTVMHRVCHSGLGECLQVLIEHGADIGIQDAFGRSAIHWAVTTESVDCLKMLLTNGAKVRSCDNEGLTPSMWACRMDNIHHFELLTTAEQEGSDNGDDMEVDNNGRTWMHWAVRRKEPLECLTTLLTEDTARLQDNEGKTVLLTASEQGSLDACKAIISIAGNTVLEDTDNQNRSALHLSAMAGHGEILNYLLEIGADPDARDNSNATPWDYAHARQLHYCKLILSAHQRFRDKNEKGKTNNSIERGRKETKENIRPKMSVSPHPPSRPPPRIRPPSAPHGGRQSDQTVQPIEREVSSAGNERTQHEPKEEDNRPEATEAFTKCNEKEGDDENKVVHDGKLQEAGDTKEKDEQHSEAQSFSGMDVSDLDEEEPPNQTDSQPMSLQQEDTVLDTPKPLPSPPPRKKPRSPVVPALPHHEEYIEGPRDYDPQEPQAQQDPPQPALRKNNRNMGGPLKMLPPGPALLPLPAQQRPPMTVEPLQEPIKKKKKKKKKQQQAVNEVLPQGYVGPGQHGSGYVAPVHPPPFNNGGPVHHPPHGGYAGPVHPPPNNHFNGGGYASPMQPPVPHGVARTPSPRPPTPNSYHNGPNWSADPPRPGAPLPPNSARDPSPPSPPGGQLQRLQKMSSEENLSAINHQGSTSPDNEFSNNGYLNNNTKQSRYPSPSLHGPLAREQAKNLLGNRQDGTKGTSPPPQNNLSPMYRNKIPNQSSTLAPPIGKGLTPPIGQTQKLSYGRNTPPPIHAPSPPGGRNGSYK